MKFIIANPKGGVTKSTVAMQIVVPYLYCKYNEKEKINLVEFDDENLDSLTFESSDIVNAKRVKISGNDLDSSLTDIVFENDNLVLDIGGNKTTTYVIKSITNCNLIDAFDCLIIPLTDGEQDSINAINLYKEIRELSQDIKIIFALGRVDNNMDLEIQFLDFYGDIKGRIDNRKGYIEHIAENDRNILKVNNSESIKVSRAFGKAVYELAKTDIPNLKQKLKEALKNKDNDKCKKIVYRISLINKAVDFKNAVINECFNVIDEVVGDEVVIDKVIA